MIVKGIIKTGRYYDSVTLMTVGSELLNLEGIEDAAVVMGTEENKSILKTSGLLLEDFKNAKDSDLLIAIKAKNEEILKKALDLVEELLNKQGKADESGLQYRPRSIDKAIEFIKDANLVLISVAGKYAFYEAYKALKNDLHVMIFSDNVSVEHEIELKKIGKEKGLLVMGPDCGTAIINGVPLAFANIVNRGDIGIVAASGTGLQEVSSIISNNNAGISQAIGTGGRDVKSQVGGIMFIEGMKALNEDENTKVIVLVSKPPADEVLKKIVEIAKDFKKPIVSIFLGGNPDILKGSNIIAETTLEKAALKAVSISKNISMEEFEKILKSTEEEIKKIAQKETSTKATTQKYLRGLFSGGTLCDEAQIILKDYIGFVYSNTPLLSEKKLEDSWKSIEHTIIDLGEDEFTVGRPHPMIDYSLRNKKIIEEAKDKEVAVILLDVVLGYGSNMEPDKELSPVIKEAKSIAEKEGRNLTIICSITGTELDPQNRKKVEKNLINAGAIVMPSNASASRLAGEILKKLK